MKAYPFIIVRDQSYPSGYANGYVAIDSIHPLFEKNYSDMVEVGDVDSIPYNGNVFGLFINGLKPDKKENELSLDMVVNVHCGLTFSDKFSRFNGRRLEWIGEVPENTDNLWVFGFDTAHAGDDLITWPREKCIEETLKLQSIMENWK